MLSGFHFQKLIVCMALIAILSGIAYQFVLGVYLLDGERSDLEKIVIVSDLTILNRKNLELVVSEEAKKGFWYMNLEHLSQSLSAMPWVEFVSVRRVWPNALIIKLRHTAPVAKWGDDTLLSNQGNIWSVDSWKKYESNMDTSTLPVLSGPVEYKQDLARRFSELSALFAKFNVSLKQLSLSTRRTWRIQLSNGVKVELGSGQLVQKMKKFLTFYSSKSDNNLDRIDYVDLRYTNGFAVKYKNRPLLVNDVLP